MVRIGNQVTVLTELVEHRETVRGKRANTARGFVLVILKLAFEALLAERQRRARARDQPNSAGMITFRDGAKPIPSPNLIKKRGLPIDLCDCSEMLG